MTDLSLPEAHAVAIISNLKAYVHRYPAVWPIVQKELESLRRPKRKKDVFAEEIYKALGGK